MIYRFVWCLLTSFFTVFGKFGIKVHPSLVYPPDDAAERGIDVLYECVGER